MACREAGGAAPASIPTMRNWWAVVRTAAMRFPLVTSARFRLRDPGALLKLHSVPTGAQPELETLRRLRTTGDCFRGRETRGSVRFQSCGTTAQMRRGSRPGRVGRESGDRPARGAATAPRSLRRKRLRCAGRQGADSAPGGRRLVQAARCALSPAVLRRLGHRADGCPRPRSGARDRQPHGGPGRAGTRPAIPRACPRAGVAGAVAGFDEFLRAYLTSRGRVRSISRSHTARRGSGRASPGSKRRRSSSGASTTGWFRSSSRRT